MKQNIEEAVRFTQQIQRIKGIVQIILFGSVARGEDTPQSDIDLAIVYEQVNKFELMKEVNKHKSLKIQTIFVQLSDLPRETELVGAWSGEGVLLYGKPIYLQEKKVGLKARVLLVYALTDLPQTEKVKVNRALYGSHSTSQYQGKQYITVTKGLVKEPGIEKISNGVLLVERAKAAKVKAMLKRFKVKVREIPFWSY